MAGSLLYVLQIESARVRAKVQFNSFEVYFEATGARRVVQTKVNPYVVPGDNRVRVSLGPELDEEGNPRPRVGMFELTLIVGEHGREPGPEAVRLHWRWPPSDRDMPLENSAVSPVWEQGVTVRERDAFGRWAWEDAPADPLTDSDLDEITAVVRLLHSAFANRDSTGVEMVLRHKHEELARALDVSFGEIEEGFREYTTELFRDPDGKMEPFFPEDLLLQPVAGGRVVQVTDLGGEPPLQGVFNGEGFAFRIAMARVDGGWTIVR